MHLFYTLCLRSFTWLLHVLTFLSRSCVKDCVRKLWTSAFVGILSYFLHQIHRINNVKAYFFVCIVSHFSWKLVWDFCIPIIIFNQQMKVEIFELTCFTTSTRHRIRQSQVWGLHLSTPKGRINIWQIMESVENVVRVSRAVLILSRAYLHSLNKSKSTVT
jgi:hypothetical protein